MKDNTVDKVSYWADVKRSYKAKKWGKHFIKNHNTLFTIIKDRNLLQEMKNDWLYFYSWLVLYVQVGVLTW